MESEKFAKMVANFSKMNKNRRDNRTKIWKKNRRKK